MGTPTSEEPAQRNPLTVAFSGDFRGRGQLVKVVRQAVVGLLVEAGCDREAQSAGMIAAQELTENLVKYSSTDQASLRVNVWRAGSQSASISLETENSASAEESGRMQRIVAEVEHSREPGVLYQERIASSSTRNRSELGLLRILAEAAMTLELRVADERVYLRATLDGLNVVPRTSLDPRPRTSLNLGVNSRR